MAKRNGLTKAQKVEQFDRVRRQMDNTDLMLHDVINNNVVYGKWITENPDAKYRVGISDRAYPLAMLTFRCKGQSDSVQVFELEKWSDELNRLRAHSDVWQPVCEALASAKNALNDIRLESLCSRAEVA